MSVETIIALLAALGIGGILGAFINRHFEQQKQTSDHDVNIFRRSDEILAEQELFDITYYHLLSSHSIKSDEFQKLRKWYSFFGQTGNHYLEKKISVENQKLLDTINDLLGYIAVNFFYIRGQGRDNDFQHLRPDWNIDIDGSAEDVAKYFQYAEELEKLTKRVMEQYSKYRLSVKKTLKI